MENVHGVIVYDCVDVLHSALTRFIVISVEHLVKSVVFLEMNIYKKDWPILVATLLLQRRLNHKTFRWRFLFFLILVTCSSGVVNYFIRCVNRNFSGQERFLKIRALR